MTWSLVLVARPELLTEFWLSPNEEIESLVTYSVLIPKLAPDDLEAFVRAELDRCGLPHAVFTAEAIALVARSSEGVLRRVPNVCLRALVEAVRDRVKTVDRSRSTACSSSCTARAARPGGLTRRRRRRARAARPL